MALTSNVERSPEELNECLHRRMESFASDLHVLSGMTKRGAVLSEKYRNDALPSIRRFVTRILDALEKGEASVQPWDRGDRNAA